MNENINNTLILITDTYPFGAVAESFLDNEIPYLSKSFDFIVIVPCYYPADIERIERKLPENITLNISLLNQIKNYKKIKFFLNINILFKFILFSKEILRKPEIIIDIRKLKKAFFYLYIANIVEKWVLDFIKETDINLSQTVFYTYWLGAATMGINLAKKKNNSIKLISRAHRYDLYEDKDILNYLPFRYETMNINRIFCVSRHGMDYVNKYYPSFKSICTISYLGVEKPDFISQVSSDGIFRIVSCSNVVPIKRIHLIILGLQELVRKRSELKIEWIHIGYGSLFEEIKKSAEFLLSNRITVKFTGYLPDNLFFDFYKNNPIDVFINVSSAEGLPVSIMEAQSFGIPVIATAVGGTPEIVTKNVGILLNENPSPEEIAEALEFFIDHPEIIKQMRLNSIENWEKNFNAAKNFTEFVKKLKML